MNSNKKIDYLKLFFFSVPSSFVLWVLLFALARNKMTQFDSIAIKISIVLTALLMVAITAALLKFTNIYNVSDDINISLGGLNRNMTKAEKYVAFLYGLLLLGTIISLKLYSLNLGLALAGVAFAVNIFELIRKNKHKYPLRQLLPTAIIITVILIYLFYRLMFKH